MNFQVHDTAGVEAVKEYLDRLPAGIEYTVKVNKRKRKRTDNQNRTYWMWLRCLSEETGNDVDDLHTYFATRFLGLVPRDVFGATVVQPISTASLTTQQFADYLTQIQSFAAHEGIILPSPEDQFYADFADNYENSQQ